MNRLPLNQFFLNLLVLLRLNLILIGFALTADHLTLERFLVFLGLYPVLVFITPSERFLLNLLVLLRS